MVREHEKKISTLRQEGNVAMRWRSVILCCLVGVLGGPAFSPAHDGIPAPPQDRPVALVGGAIHTVSGGVIENGTVVFDGGAIVDVGRNVTIPSGAERVDITGRHVYPGLIEAVSQLGLAEISAVRATLDYLETGDVNPNVRAETAVNPDSERIPVTRSNGIAVAGVLPAGGLVSGMAALIMLDGWTWEDMTLAAPAGMVVNWPGMRAVDAFGAQKSTEEQRKNLREQLKRLDRIFEDARAYMKALDAARTPKPAAPYPETDLRWESMIPVLRGEVPVWVTASRLDEIEAAVEWADRVGVKLVIVGGYDAPRAADLLKRKDIPVIVTPINRLPGRRHSPYDEAYTVPARLHEAGVRFCIAGAERYGNERNVPYHAAMAAAFGLPREEALRAITLSAAEILGVGERIGSVEKGKDATLIVTDGDPLEITTAVERLYIMGRAVDLENRQTGLYRKYTEKYRRLGDE